MLQKLQALVALGALSIAAPAAAQDPFQDTTSSETYDATEASEAPATDEATTAEPARAAATSDEPGAEASEIEPPTEYPKAEPKEAEAATGGAGADASMQSAEADASPDLKSGAAIPDDKGMALGKWNVGLSGYFRAPMALGISKRPGPDDLTGEPQTQISYGPNRTVDANYFSFAYTRLQEQDWVELFIHAKRDHVQATIGWMGYWFASAGFRNPDAAWVPGIAYLTLDTDFQVGKLTPNIAVSAGAWWPNFGRFDKYDTFTLGQFRQLGGQLKLTLPFAKDVGATVWQGFGTGRDGSFNILAPPFYNARVGLNLIYYAHLDFKFKEWFDIGLHYNLQWTRDPNLLDSTGEDKSYSNARDAHLWTLGGEVKVRAPYAGSLWVSPSLVDVKNGWALGSAGVEVVHGLSPAGLASNYLGWNGSPSTSTGSGHLINLGFLYENKLSNVLGAPPGGKNEVTLNVFGLMVDSVLDRPAGSQITQNKISQFKWGADIEYNPWKWLGLMARWDQVNYDLNNPGYIFSAITGRLSFYSHYLSGERIYLQYSRYQYGDNMTLAGTWPWGTTLVAGSDIIQDTVYIGSKPDMDVVKLQADIRF